ncbi:MAG: class I SAM-dependent methyltransferase [Hyphomicrobiales bacterium]
MPLDVVDLRNFYAGTLGRVTRRLLSETIRERWKNTRALATLGIGYATPYLGQFQEESERVLAFMPEGQGVVNWPSNGVSSTALVRATMLPLPDTCIDRILVIHGLEIEESPGEMLSELWRVLTPGGRIIAIVPNRSGFWARVDTTPFGQGQPFSRRQLNNLLRDSLFSPIHWAEALYVPPVQRPLFLKSADVWERMGSVLPLPVAGVHLVEATKLLHRPMTVRRVRHTQGVLSPVFVPATQARLDENICKGH